MMPVKPANVSSPGAASQRAAHVRTGAARWRDAAGGDVVGQQREVASKHAGGHTGGHASGRRMLLDAVGVSLLITWSFVFWNGRLLSGAVASGAGMDALFLLQGTAATAAALVVVFAYGAMGERLAFAGAGVATAVLACASTILAGIGAWGALASAGMGLFAFALSGVGSTLFLFWQQHLSVRGTDVAATRMAAAYALSLAEFVLVSLIPTAALLVITALLPIASLALLIASDRLASAPVEKDVRAASDQHVRSSSRAPGTLSGLAPGISPAPKPGALTTPAPGSSSASPSARTSAPGSTPTRGWSLLVERMAAIPWRLPAAVAVAHFCYGVTRIGGIALGNGESPLFDALAACVPIVCCLLAVGFAYAAYRTSPMVDLYVAFPMLALGCILAPGEPGWGDIVTFGMANVGSELVRHIAWFLLIDTIVKDGISALLCLALLRVAHWGGCTLGLVAAQTLGPGTLLSGIVVMLLMMGIFAVLGVDTLFAPPTRQRGRRAPKSQLNGPKADGGKAGGTGASAARADATRAENPVSGSHEETDAGQSIQARVTTAAQRYGLSPREAEVLSIWVTGCTASYIEKSLFISRSTVKTHLNHIYMKTNTANRDELVRLVLGEAPSS